MGPAKGTRTISKTVIKGCVDQQHPEDPESSSKSKQKKRKIAELDPKWSKDELTHFYEAYRRHGKDWKKISLAVGSKSSDMVQSLYSIHRTFLSLPERQATATGFIALVTGHHNILDESTSRGGGQTGRASGKARQRRDAPEQKANGGPDLPHSSADMKISGFSPSFKKRYYGGLVVRKGQTHSVRRRTSRIPVTFTAERIATDDDMAKGVKNSTKNNAEGINNVCDNSPNRSSGITEANKAYQGQIFLDSKEVGDAEMSQSQHLKKRKIKQTMDVKVQTGKVEHETMMEAKEEIKLSDSLDQQQILSDFISEDDMLVLDVLQSLVNAPSETSKLKINNASGSLGETYSTIFHRMEEDHSPCTLSKKAKPVGMCSAPKTRQEKNKKILDAEVHVNEQNISVSNLVQPEGHTVRITEVSSYSVSKRPMLETSVNSCAEVKPSAPAETKSEIKMSRRTIRKSKMNCKTKYVPHKCTEGSDNLQARKLQNGLSSELFRRWCTYEWFYSAVDYPWFSNNEFVSYLNHANLCHIPRLTRSEWSTVRSSLGKPRRFSDQLLAMEKEKLEDYRENVRKIYAQLSNGSQNSLPVDLARPFSIGQQVIVRHPSSKEICDGKVVMMGRDFYKVHFSNPDLGVDIVKDTDCMPVNWLENLPDDMKRSCLSNNVQSVLYMERIPNLTTSENLYHTTNGLSVHEKAKTLHLIPDEKFILTVNSERPQNRHTSDGGALAIGCPDNKFGPSDELESYVTSFIERSLSQARHIVAETMQANSDGEELGASNQPTDCIGQESEAAIRNDRLPSNLISNCMATVISIKHLSDSRHPPAHIAGVLERASSMLRPSCPENIAVYKEIEGCLSVIASQILALVPTTLGSGPALSPM